MILVVDDNQAVLRSVARCLRASGYEVAVASDPRQALEFARNHSDLVDVLLTDIVMQECNGVQLARTLERSLPDLKVMFMTGHVGRSARSELVHGTSANVILKPFDSAQLLQRLGTLVPPSGTSFVSFVDAREGARET